MLENKKAFLFDMDGLLIDSEKMHLDLWLPIFEKYGVKNGEDVLYKVIGVTGEMSKQILLEYTGNADFFSLYREEKEEATNRFLEENGMPVKKGAKELLDYLKERQYPMVLVTSTRKDTVNRFLHLANLDGYFDHMICGDEVSKSKPDPEGYLKAVEKYHLNKEECVILEDSRNGILAGNQAGIDVIGIPDLLDISDYNCTLYSNLLEVLDELKQNEKKILITGFEAFDGDELNPTEETVKILPEYYLNYTITKKVLPVDTTCFSYIENELEQYNVIISMGLAAMRKTYTIEQIGINIDDFRIPSNLGETKNHEIIEKDGLDGYFSTLPIDRIIEHLKTKNIEMRISYSAGTYICNHILYELGYHLHNTKQRYGFIHVPSTTDYEGIKEMVLGVIEVL